MFDVYPFGTHFKEPRVFMGRIAGQGNVAPIAITNVPDSQSQFAKVVRNNTGNLTLTLYDGVNAYNVNQPATGTIQSYDFQVAQPQGTTNVRSVLYAPPVLGANYFAFNLQVYQTSNVSNNQDLAVGEEITFMVVLSASVRP